MTFIMYFSSSFFLKYNYSYTISNTYLFIIIFYYLYIIYLTYKSFYLAVAPLLLTCCLNWPATLSAVCVFFILKSSS